MKQAFVQLMSTFFPDLMVKLAYRQLTTPQIMKLRVHEQQMLDRAEQERIPFKGFEIQTYHWKGGPESVLLIHGWEGQAGNFSDLIAKLLEQQFTVYAFDGPSHGFSSKGKTSLFEFTELVAFMIKKLKVRKLVSHSFGGVATTYSLFENQDIAIDKYVLLTTPDKFSERISDVARKVGISDNVKNKLINRLQAETQMDLSQLNVSDFVKAIDVKQSLIIHDKNDRVIPIRQSQNVCKHWKVCELRAIEGTGHFRILRTEKVIDQVVAFLS